MSRRAKGPRLWLRPARRDGAGTLTHEPAWFILDGTIQRSTGLGIVATTAEKEQALNAYLTSKHSATIGIGKRDPSQVLINDVLTIYHRDIVMPDDDRKQAGHARPGETRKRIEFLRKFWKGRTLDQVTGPTCREYVRQRSTPAAARRDLEDLRSAINHHRREGLHDKIVSVVLPEKSLPRERWLTRKEAAAVIWSAWRYREVQNLRATDRRTRRHVARFMIVARYMGSRASVICGASIEPRRPAGKPWVDLTTGVFYGRPVGQRETKKRRQTVRLPTPLLAHLRRWRARGQRYVVQWLGKPVERITKAHNAAVFAAGLGPDVTPHIWRHTVATWLMQAGADPWKAADFLGMSVQTLLRVYGHHHPEHSADVHDAFAAHRRQRSAKDKSEQTAIVSIHPIAEKPVKSA